MVCASACWPRPRCSTRTLAICALGMVLPAWISSGSTWPEKRSTSTLLLTPICFSPAISRWPLGSTSTTMTLMLPKKSLLFSVAPLPAKLLLLLPSALARSAPTGLMPASALTLASTLPLLSTELVDFWLATTFSTISTFNVSPRWRAR